MKKISSPAVITSLLLLICYSSGASAELTNDGLLDQVISEFAARATTWKNVILSAATWLFWTLGTIAMVWTFGMMALRKADIAEYFAELCRFIVFFGFYLWLLRNGPDFAASIIRSMQRLAEQASGITSVTPSSIVDIGFVLLGRSMEYSSALRPVDSAIGILMTLAILVILAVIAINMLVLLLDGWMLSYAGIFFLGFGGSRWTSDMAINYYKTVLAVGVQLLAMVLLVGIGSDLLNSFYLKMSKGILNFPELGVMLVFTVCLFLVVKNVPSRLSGIITGSSIASTGSGSFGAGAIAGAALGAAGVTSAAMSMTGSMATSGLQNVGGGISAIKAAVEKAQGQLNDSVPISQSNTSAPSDQTGQTPLAGAMGLASTSSLQQAAKLAVGATTELGKGVSSALVNKAAAVKQNAQEKVSQSFGGQVAEAIYKSAGDWDSDERKDEDSYEDEIAAFVAKGAESHQNFSG